MYTSVPHHIGLAESKSLLIEPLLSDMVHLPNSSYGSATGYHLRSRSDQHSGRDPERYSIRRYRMHPANSTGDRNQDFNSSCTESQSVTIMISSDEA